MGKDIQTIELFISDEQEDGVFAISLVDSPAIEENFIALSKEQPNRIQLELKAVDEKRKIVVGYALIPDFEILRTKKDGTPFNVVMSKETVALSAKLYMKNLNLQNVTSEHEKPVTDCCVIESWVTESVDHDKVNLFGIEPILGGWAVMMSLSDAEFAKVEDGTYKGFSIEAKMDGFEALEQSKEKTDNMSEEEELLEQLTNILENGDSK